MPLVAFDHLDYDVIVIGAGCAGLRAAIEANDHGARTAVICKSLLGKASTVVAQGGIAAAVGTAQPHDEWRSHFSDTMRAGHLVNDWRVAQIHAEEAPARLHELVSWGALFDRTREGVLAQRQLGGHSTERVAYRADRVGLEIMRALQQRTMERAIPVHAECSVQRLLLHDGRICGALVLRRTTGRFVVMRCKTIVLASGGGAGAWQINSNPSDSTGDGVALAAQAGADLMDMEFVQFHPTAVVWPSRARGIVVSEALLTMGATLLNAEGRPLSERTALTQLARTIECEVREGRGTPHGGVWLDASRCADIARTTTLVRQIKTLCGVDLTRERLEVGISCHGTLGGVRVDAESSATSVRGLFAAGEVAAGLHGAGRLGGNALSGALVFGRRAGAGAAQYCRDVTMTPVDAIAIEHHARELLAPFDRRGGENPFVLTAELKNCMHEAAGITRSGDELADALAKVRAIAARSPHASVSGGRAYNPGWHLWLDLRSLIVFAEATIRSALERQESRGSHVRRDFRETEARCDNTNVIVRKSPQGLTTFQHERPEMPRELRRRIQWEHTQADRNGRSAYGAVTPAVANSSTTA